jgi:membrane protein DedA with SNARE-associated domain
LEHEPFFGVLAFALWFGPLTFSCWFAVRAVRARYNRSTATAILAALVAPLFALLIVCAIYAGMEKRNALSERNPACAPPLEGSGRLA